jgi:hypothetical protein
MFKTFCSYLLFSIIPNNLKSNSETRRNVLDGFCPETWEDFFLNSVVDFFKILSLIFRQLCRGDLVDSVPKSNCFFNDATKGGVNWISFV